jgi:hypothetical protein
MKASILVLRREKCNRSLEGESIVTIDFLKSNPYVKMPMDIVLRK